ncbi:MAG: sugar phosphate isomerase/epimerase [Clostridia bacterium]|nr:sugar phosphate isomerase/epimerase [Clostridia bacterium]
MSYKAEFGLRGHDISCVSLEDMAEKASEIGITRVQLAMRKTMADIKWQNGMFSFGFADYIKRTLDKKGISVPVLSSYINLTEMTKAQEDQFIDTLKFANVIGAGMVGSETGNILLEGFERHSEEAYHRVVNNVRRLADVAEKLGVMIGIEPVCVHTICSVEMLKRLIDDVNSPNICVIFDLVNILTAENFKDYKDIIKNAFELFGDRISAIHLKDVKLDDGKLVRTTPGEGDIDYNFYFNLIKEKKPHLDIILDELPSSLYKEVTEKLQLVWDKA